MVTLLNHFPAWLLGLVFVTIIAALACTGLYFVRKNVPGNVLMRSHDVAGFIINIIGVLYAVVLAFVVIAVWEDYEDANTLVDKEANTLTDIYCYAGAVSDPASRQLIREEAKNYVSLVLNDEWPAMAVEKESDKAHDAIRRLNKQLLAYEPVTQKDKSLYDQMLKDMSDLHNCRESRLLNMRSHVPFMVWFILVLCGLLTICFSYFFSVENGRIHYLMIAALSGTIAFIFFLGVALDFPFSGTARITPDSFQRLLDHIMPMY